MRILLFGSNGQVGSALLSQQEAGEVVAVDRSQCDLRDTAAVRATIAEIQPEAIVNAAAYTAVDRAESERDACFAVNADAPAAMAQEAAARGIPLIHYSTDYVFDGTGKSPYTEDASTAPLNVYGASKLAGERAVAASGARCAILRTSWVYSNHGNNFLNTMLRLGAQRPELRIVDDQRGAPTSASAIAEATLRILHQHPQFPSGVFHMTAAGETTWFGFASAIFAGADEGRVPKLEPIPSASYPTPARRPMYSVLDNGKFEQVFGFRLAPWQQQLTGVLNDRARHVQPA